MSYAVDIPSSLSALIEGFPIRTRVAIYGTLARLVVHADVWPPGDKRWEQLAWQDGDGMRFYADDCCVRVEVLPDERLLVVRELARVLVHLPAQELAGESDALGSLAEQ